MLRIDMKASLSWDAKLRFAYQSFALMRAKLVLQGRTWAVDAKQSFAWHEPWMASQAIACCEAMENKKGFNFFLEDGWFHKVFAYSKYMEPIFKRFN